MGHKKILQVLVSVENESDAAWLWQSEGHVTPMHGVLVESIKDVTHATQKQVGPGYHLREIKKGELGEWSKVQEEFEEWKEAGEQNSRLMELLELADLMGAMEAFFNTHGVPGLVNDMMVSALAHVDGEASWYNTIVRRRFTTLSRLSATPVSKEFASEVQTFWGAVAGGLEIFGLTLSDLRTMKNITARAFQSGHRQ